MDGTVGRMVVRATESFSNHRVYGEMIVICRYTCMQFSLYCFIVRGFNYVFSLRTFSNVIVMIKGALLEFFVVSGSCTDTDER